MVAYGLGLLATRTPGNCPSASSDLSSVGTNPEQLIAAAHASCFTMALSNVLSAAGHAPESLRTNARVQRRNIDGTPTLARMTLETEGRVTGVDEQQFQAYADEAKRVCPVSRALAGIPEIVLTAKLAAGA